MKGGEKRMKSMRKLLGNESGFTLVELAIGLVIIGLLIGAILGGASMIKNSKIKRQMQDLQGLYGVVYTYFDRFMQLPGDPDGDGYLNESDSVWAAVEREELAYSSKRSPFGSSYYFGSDTSTAMPAHRNGNFIMVSIPKDVASQVDRQLDDGCDSTGIVTTDGNYTGSGKTDLYYFLD
jgi:prepilin-type N-terminal cleavage/methylation domain-containing protein